MDRRVFLKTAGLGAAALASSNVLTNTFALAQRASGTGLKNWVWMGPSQAEKSADDWKRSFALMRESGVTAILPEIFNGVDAVYASERLPVKTDWLGTILPLARAEGLEVHGWIVCMEIRVEDLMKKHPDWYSVNAKGESSLDKPAYVDRYKFLDPGRPEVREWVQENVKEVASIPEITGVHLDVIRHPDAILPKALWKKYNVVQDKVYPAYDYGYTEYERNRFKEKFGVDPITLKDPNSNKDWMQFRFDMVTDLVNGYLVPAAHAKGKKITAAVFPGPTLAREMVRQDWGRWKLDGFLPMLYHQMYEVGPEWVKEQTKEGVTTAKAPVYSGLMVGGLDEAAFTQTVEAGLAGGTPGVALFSARGMDDVKWKALKKITEAKRA